MQRLDKSILNIYQMKFVLADRSAKQLGRKELEILLSQPNLLRLGVVDESNGLPIVHPVWYIYKGEKFFIATDKDGVKARSLRKNPNAYFLVDVDSRPPRGARGRGIAKVVDDVAYATQVTKENVLKYLGTTRTKTAKAILATGATSSVIEITPTYMATWKF